MLSRCQVFNLAQAGVVRLHKEYPARLTVVHRHPRKATVTTRCHEPCVYCRMPMRAFRHTVGQPSGPPACNGHSLAW